MVLENKAVLKFGIKVNGPNVENEWKNTAQLNDYQKVMDFKKCLCIR